MGRAMARGGGYRGGRSGGYRSLGSRYHGEKRPGAVMEWSTELDVNAEKMEMETEKFITMLIKQRTRDGGGSKRRKLRKYSKAYKRRLQYARESTKTDLTRSGKMIDSFRLIKTGYVVKGGKKLIIRMLFGVPPEYLKRVISLAHIGFSWIGLRSEERKAWAQYMGEVGAKFKVKRSKKRVRG